MSSLTQTLRYYLRDSETSWGCGTFGAIAEFARDPGETVEISGEGLTAVTARGGMRLSSVSDIRPIAYERAGPHPDTWQHSLALCLPADRCRLARREVLTELGPDAEALRPEDCETVLFDLGLAIDHADICVRTADPGAINLMRKGLGRSLLSADGLPLLHEIASLSPHRVFRCRSGRIEVYQPIAGPDEKTPPGPHTHVMPRLLALRRTHAATLPIPSGWVPCFTLFPPNPIRSGHGGIKPFDRGQIRGIPTFMGALRHPGVDRAEGRGFCSPIIGRTGFVPRSFTATGPSGTRPRARGGATMAATHQ